MNIEAFLKSLTEQERNFISNLDYTANHERHRAELDKVIENGGLVYFIYQGCWYPYEVIELGTNVLMKGHEREFTACVIIVLMNILNGGDRSNDINCLVDYYHQESNNLTSDLRMIIEPIIKKISAEEFLKSLIESERNFIASLDSHNPEVYKESLDEIIANGGLVNLDEEYWLVFYSKIETGLNNLMKNHEREFTACLLIVLINIESGSDTLGLDSIIKNHHKGIEELPIELSIIIDSKISRLIDASRYRAHFD